MMLLIVYTSYLQFVFSFFQVMLKPGHSLMDWIKLGRSGKDLTGLGGRMMEVSSEELKKHNTEKDCWIALRGRLNTRIPFVIVQCI